MGSGVVFDALEFVDRASLRAVNSSGLFGRERWDEAETLFLRFSGKEQVTQTHISLVNSMREGRGCRGIRISSDPVQVDAWWNVRKLVGKCLVMAMKQGEVFMASDAAVPRSRLVDIIVETQEAMEDVGFFCSTLGHIGDGNIHVAILCPEDQRERGEKLIEDVQRRALRLEGTITGEHGIGTKTRDMLVEEVGSVGVDMMRIVRIQSNPPSSLRLLT
ncbi:unnamed protein product [Periconia digitata]|uniref:FAD-binding oxidoreductase/transferase type 4 C-terminal domain-containing protein n=1 Tax=Periconia digitata TaxID=1303443 RepID=A0A9W4XSE2_9PLEO|nr:unnamed protein product [Periconia digitata]